MSSLENEFFSQLTKQALRDSNAPIEDTKASDRFTWAIIGILAFVGVEAVKVTFRKNFGRNGLNLIRLFICSICFAGIAAICLYLRTKPEEEIIKYGLAGSFVPAAIFYITASLFIVSKGIAQLTSNKFLVNPDHTGDSYILGFLQREGWSKNAVQNIAEPLTVIVIGASLSFINLLWGLPLVFCGLSVWIHQIMRLIFFNKAMEQNLNELQSRQQPENQFHKIS